MSDVLIACEFSGLVRDAFIARGHNALSCDLLPSERPGPHYQGDVRELLGKQWDMMIAFPPCTHLCSSGARWFAEKRQAQQESLDFVRMLLSADIPRIALENPVGIISTYIRKPDQIIQPYWFGSQESKQTCLWLKNLPPLMATCLEMDRAYSIHHMPESKARARKRSRTFPEVAYEMARQWG